MARTQTKQPLNSPLILAHDKDCKHSTRYSAELRDGQTFSIYVPNSLLSNPHPQRIAVSIQPLQK